jgi:2-amino-4-hydroxy-6-hydroxymethyldihydropteridine diphosphokinase
MTDRWMDEGVLVGLGSNLGDRRSLIEQAIEKIDAIDGVRFARVSRIRKTAPIGGPRQRDFLNAAGEIFSTIEPPALLGELQRIEDELGRVREERWGPRSMDLDILLFGDRVIDTPDLVVPHPLMTERGFVLEPLAELVPTRRHPVLGTTMLELWRAVDSPAPSTDGNDAHRRSS